MAPGKRRLVIEHVDRYDWSALASGAEGCLVNEPQVTAEPDDLW
jgi:hypothetical protein